MAFDIDRFVSLSKAVETSDLDWDYIAEKGVTDAEARILRYMADVESHTILYLRDLLAGHTSRDPEVTAFMSCWVYEETLHGRAIDQVLAAAGRPEGRDRYTRIADKALQERGDLDSRARRQVVDMVAATVILQDWLDHGPTAASEGRPPS